MSSLSTTWWSIGNTAEFGSEIELGDIDGDGTFDLLVSAPYQNGIFSQTGTVFGFLDVGSVVGETLSINPDWQIDGVSIASNTGEHFWVGDLDSLGPDDVLIGNPNADRMVAGGGTVSVFTDIDFTEADVQDADRTLMGIDFLSTGN